MAYNAGFFSDSAHNDAALQYPQQLRRAVSAIEHVLSAAFHEVRADSAKYVDEPAVSYNR